MISKSQIKLVRSLEQKKHRMAEGLFVAEGPKVVGDLLACHFRPRFIFATDQALSTGERVFTDAAKYVMTVTEDELHRLSFLQHPQQVLALFELPSTYDSDNLPPSSGGEGLLFLALDGIQDPGNLGTIIRVADWYGIDAIYCSRDTADAWSPKVVQATMGSIARVNIIYLNLIEMLDALPTDFPVYGTFLDGDNIYQQSLSKNGLIIMGNEGNGISKAVRSRITRRLLIPSFRQGDTAESLNVAIATAITCSEFRRRG